MDSPVGGGSLVAKGNHVVPAGVAVEELDGGKKKLRDDCPPDLANLLRSKEAFEVYDRLVKTVVDESSTRNVFGTWRDMEFDSILDVFRDDFAQRDIKVALCKRTSGSGTYRWLEFIDTSTAPSDYVPQFDVANMSGQQIKTCYSTLYFPKGVAVEKFSRYGKARKKLKEKCPIYVEELLTHKGLMSEYDALVDHFIEAGKGACMTQNWDTKNLQAIADAHKATFEAKGVSIFISHKQEYISHGQNGGHYEYFRWTEFVDREEQPNYFPQRDANSKKEKGCVVM